MGVAISLVYSTRQRYNMKVFLFLSLCAALAQAATTPSSLTEEQEKLVSQLEDQELAKEVEGIISGMDEEQLARLEEGLPNKLGPLGFLGLHSILQDDEDIKDLVDLSEMIAKFLRRVPELEVKLELGKCTQVRACRSQAGD